jgi:hypothetical protein
MNPPWFRKSSNSPSTVSAVNALELDCWQIVVVIEANKQPRNLLRPGRGDHRLEAGELGLDLHILMVDEDRFTDECI